MTGGRARRLGVSRAMVDGTWVDGDVAVDGEGLVAGVGLVPARPTGRVAVPGFVDLQLNGAHGIDVVGAGAGDLLQLAGALAGHGVVAFAPTSFSASPEAHRSVVAAVAEARAARSGDGARLLAPHLEGPFLAPSWAGAHEVAHLLPPDTAFLDVLLETGPLGMITVAPELDGALALVRHAVARGVRVAVGHTGADAAGVRAALDAGASVLTHVFNAHRRFGARDPGPAGVALTDARCHVTVVADGHHLAPETVRLVLAAAGERVVVVSDAVAPAGTGDGPTAVRGRPVTVVDGRVQLADGTLAGAARLADGALRHLLSIGVDPVVALAALATVPARLAGLGPHDLRPGHPARAVVLDDRWEVVS